MTVAVTVVPAMTVVPGVIVVPAETIETAARDCVVTCVTVISVAR